MHLQAVTAGVLSDIANATEMASFIEKTSDFDLSWLL